jgi:hypothetical protein
VIVNKLVLVLGVVCRVLCVVFSQPPDIQVCALTDFVHTANEDHTSIEYLVGCWVVICVVCEWVGV